MGKLLTVDDLEIIFEKQSDNHDCRWCVYVRARKGQKEKNILISLVKFTFQRSIKVT